MASKIRQTFVRHTLAAEFPVPSESTIIFLLKICPPSKIQELAEHTQVLQINRWLSRDATASPRA